MAAPHSTAAAIALPPAEAIAFLRGKTNTTSQHWTDVWAEAHTRSFMVAGAASQALVSDFREAVAKALEHGTTLADFRRDFDAIVAKHGWVHNGTPAWRSQIIFETNLSMAYSAGRYAQMTEPDTLRVYPFWQYQHTSSLHPRPQHLAWVGTTLRYDDPWWATHYPPNGWRCRCSVRPVSEAGLRRQGKTGPDTAPPVDLRPWRNPHTGAVVDVPAGIDPGFGYNPGAAWTGGPPPASGAPTPPAAPPAPALPVPGPRPPRLPPAEAVEPPPTAAPAVHVLPTMPDPVRVEPGFDTWVDALIRSRRPDGTARTVGVLPQAVLDMLDKAGTPLRDPTLSIQASDVLHIARDSKAASGRAMPIADLRRLPALLAAPAAVLRERRTGAIIYAWTPSDPAEARTGKVVVHLRLSANVVRGGRRSRTLLNTVKSAALVPPDVLRDINEYELIEGTL